MSNLLERLDQLNDSTFWSITIINGIGKQWCGIAQWENCADEMRRFDCNSLTELVQSIIDYTNEKEAIDE